MARLVRCRHCGGEFRDDRSADVAWELASCFYTCRRCGHDVSEPPPRAGESPPLAFDSTPLPSYLDDLGRVVVLDADPPWLDEVVAEMKVFGLDRQVPR